MGVMVELGGGVYSWLMRGCIFSRASIGVVPELPGGRVGSNPHYSAFLLLSHEVLWLAGYLLI